MSEPPPIISRDRGKLLVVIVTAGLVLALAEWGSTRLLPDQSGQTVAGPVRAENVTLFPKDPFDLPAATGEPSVWMVGNSHMYALPGMKQGDPLQVDATGIVIDELAEGIRRRCPSAEVNLYLLSYPNFLPFEMLTRVGQLLHSGYRPTVAFVGLTFTNIARNSQLRHEVYRTYREWSFAEAFEDMLANPAVGADPDVVAEVRSQRRRVERDQEAERLRSDSDRLDERLTAWAADRLTLMGKSADLRAQIFRGLTSHVQSMWDDRQSVKYSYDLIEHDYAFNLKCLRATLRLLKHSGATVFCYYAPERTDLPAMTDPRKQDQFIAEFNREAQQLGVTVLDARRVVPNEYWGWVGDSPDRSHFTQVGHQRLAEFLLEEAEKRSAWKELARP